MSLAVVDAYPAAALARPGSPVTLRVDVANDGGTVAGVLHAELRVHAARVVDARVPVDLAGGAQTLSVALPAPPDAPDGTRSAGGARGYEALLRLEADGATLHARTAVLMADHWRSAPRYGFLSEFAPGDPQPERIRELAKFHVTVVQFYDWMYRHYAFLPPEDAFEDAMGRTLSRRTVEARVAACRAAGMAALAYGAVYGAEPEFVSEHPEWVLRDADGDMLSLIDLFYITDLRPGAAWREHILREFEAAVRDAGFDGIHMDQYGFPKWSYDAHGDAVRLDDCFRGLVDEAAARVASAREGAAVLFNAVNNWPIDRVAPSDQAAVYIEVWPPHDRYRDLVELVRRARDLSGKQAILAAYLEPFREGGAGAENAALLATAVIASAGGHHLLLGEGHGVLRDPYYPNHGHMEPAFARRMRRYYDHTAAHHRDLFDPGLRDVTTSLVGGINTEITLTGAPLRAHPEPGGVWVAVRQDGNRFVVNLVNLVGIAGPEWNAPKEAGEVQEGLALRFSKDFAIERAVWASPDEDAPARELRVARAPVAAGGPSVQGEPRGTRLELPPLACWATVVVFVREA